MAKFWQQWGLQGWFLWENIRSFSCVQQRQHQPAPRGTTRWPRLSLAVMVVVPVGNVFNKGKKCCTTAARREEWEYVKETALQTPRSVKTEAGEVPQMPEQRFPYSLWGRPWRDNSVSVSVTLSLERTERWKESSLRFVFTYYYPFLIFWQ